MGSLLTVQRRWPDSVCVLGQMDFKGAHECYTMEPAYAAPDVKPRCIPAGTYPLTIRFSKKFARLMPHVENVPQFDGVLIHWGNRPADTEGCILLGMQRGADLITDSQAAFDDFWALYIAAIQRGEEVWLTVGVTQPS